MPCCSIKGCKNTNLNCKYKCISFFSFPKSKEYKEKWLKYVKYPMLNIKNARVCSIHFLRNSYKPKPAYLQNIEGHIPVTCRKLLDTAVPTEYLNGEKQPQMFGTKTEWIPSDGLNKPSPKKKTHRVKHTAKSIDNFGSSHFLNDDFIIYYNSAPVKEILNKNNIEVERLAINERIHIYPEESKLQKEKIYTTTVNTDQETITVYTLKEFNHSRELQKTTPQSKHPRLQKNTDPLPNEKLGVKNKKTGILNRKL